MLTTRSRSWRTVVYAWSLPLSSIGLRNVVVAAYLILGSAESLNPLVTVATNLCQNSPGNIVHGR